MSLPTLLLLWLSFPSNVAVADFSGSVVSVKDGGENVEAQAAASAEEGRTFATSGWAKPEVISKELLVGRFL
jgi:hypothetical protein